MGQEENAKKIHTYCNENTHRGSDDNLQGY